MKSFEMTQKQLAELMSACERVPLIALGGGRIPSTPQENANRAWRQLGKEMGFDPMTVQPDGRGDRFFKEIGRAHV